MSNEEKSEFGGKYLRCQAAAVYCGVSTSKLAKLRMQRNRSDGPRFIKIAGCIVYKTTDLDDWLNAHVVGAS